MDPFRDPERSKARAWDDTSSDVALPTEETNQNVPPHMRNNHVYQEFLARGATEPTLRDVSNSAPSSSARGGSSQRGRPRERGTPSRSRGMSSMSRGTPRASATPPINRNTSAMRGGALQASATPSNDRDTVHTRGTPSMNRGASHKSDTPTGHSTPQVRTPSVTRDPSAGRFQRDVVGDSSDTPTRGSKFSRDVNQPPRGGNGGIGYGDRKSSQNADQPSRGGREGIGYGRTPYVRKSEAWASMTPIIKTRVAEELEKQAKIQAIQDEFVNNPDYKQPFPTIGYYLWEGSTKPTALLGGVGEELNLPALNDIRISRRVRIDWDVDQKCLRVFSTSPDDNENVVPAALEDIGHAIKNAKAAQVVNTPLFIVVPPAASVMKSIVTPLGCEERQGKNVAIGAQFVGEPFSKAEQDLWKTKYDQMLLKNRTNFERRLIADTKKLKYSVPWMRMRVHFGHVCLRGYNSHFRNSEFDFNKYSSMMTGNRIEGSLDRMLEASFATKLIDLVLKYPADDPMSFTPFQSQTFSLTAVEPKHMEIIFIQPHGAPQLRLEAEIDCLPETEQTLFEVGTATGQYQVGAVKLFNSNTANTRVEITTVDIQSGFDWVFEIIEDSQNPDLTSAMKSVIQNSISRKTESKKDSLGLVYPGVKPRLSDFQKEYAVIDEVVIKSTYSYNFGGYIVDIVIFRTWFPGKDKKIEMTNQPRLHASISMYHLDWAYQTSALYNTKVRDWDDQLIWAFGNGGYPVFLDHVKFLQKLLVEANML